MAWATGAEAEAFSSDWRHESIGHQEVAWLEGHAQQEQQELQDQQVQLDWEERPGWKLWKAWMKTDFFLDNAQWISWSVYGRAECNKACQIVKLGQLEKRLEPLTGKRITL